MKVGIAQISPIALDRDGTLAKVAAWSSQAADAGCALVAFGETLAPAYPFWLSRTDAARFDAADQKRLHARYLDQGVTLDGGHLDGVRAVAAERSISIVLGVAERASDRGGHTLYCTRVFIDPHGEIVSAHRKLMPTYEERLAWGIGDGAGLVTHRMGPFTVGALNCWENWMPLARAALYAQGEDLHVMLWPGCARLTRDITRFAALEGRSYVISASALIREQDIPADFPDRDRVAAPGEIIYDGGSCIAGPDGAWIVEPVVGREALLTADLDHSRVLGERQNFDPAGHYARPDVLRLQIDRRRQTGFELMERE